MRHRALQMVLIAVAIACTSKSSSIISPSSTDRAHAAALARPAGLPLRNLQSSIVNLQFLPGRRTLLDAHNAYPDRGRFADRVDVALSTGLPVAIEQDVAWCVSAGGVTASLVSHESTCVGGEPTLEAYLFQRVRPIVEAALPKGPAADVAAHHPQSRLQDQRARTPCGRVGAARQVRTLAHGDARRPCNGGGAATGRAAPGPTGSPDVQQVTFHDVRPRGRPACGYLAPLPALPAPESDPTALPRATPATNYRRWWNHPWKVVEPEGQRAAGEWTTEDAARLTAIVSG